MAPTLHQISAELGLLTLLAAPRDVHLLFLTRFLRMTAYGSISLILALFFAALAITPERIGLFMTLTLLGDVALSLLLTLVADAVGRRRILLLGCVSMAFAGGVFFVASSYWLLLFAAVVGVISVSGNEIGPFRAVEESVLAGLVAEAGRSDIFAWYVVLGTLGSAVGLAGTGVVVEGLKGAGWAEVECYRLVFGFYGGVGVVKGVVTGFLSESCEVDGGRSQGYVPVAGQNAGTTASPDDDDDDDENEPDRPLAQPAVASKPKMGFASLSTKTRWTLLRLCALFAVDSLASGMVPYSLINFYLDGKFHMPKDSLGTIMSVVFILSSIGNIFASAISKRIGLIKTMVFTHLPSAIFLAMLPAASTVWMTIVLLVARGTLSSMDQAPRSAFLSRVVAAEERTAVMGIVNVVKTLSQSGGPTVTGVLAGNQRFWIAFVVAGTLKASYDLGLMTFFLKVERQAGGPRPAQEALSESSDDGSDAYEYDGSDAYELVTDDESGGAEEPRTK